jgi:hypothetical protein
LGTGEVEPSRAIDVVPVDIPILADYFSSIRYSRIAGNQTRPARAATTDRNARVAAHNISVLKMMDLKFLKTATLR